MYLWHSFFGILRAFKWSVSQNRSRCRTGAGGSCSGPVLPAMMYLPPFVFGIHAL